MFSTFQGALSALGIRYDTPQMLDLMDEVPPERKYPYCFNIECVGEKGVRHGEHKLKATSRRCPDCGELMTYRDAA